MVDKFFIKDSYIPNKLPVIKRHNFVYWDKQRIYGDHFNPQYFVYKFCKRLIKAKKIKSTLDIGCGDANKLIKMIKPVCDQIYGIDEKRIIGYNKKRFDSNKFYSDNIDNSKLDLKQKFDLILSAGVIEHLLNPDNLINMIKKFSHHNTYIVISTPEREIIRGEECNFSPNETHVREWDAKEFKNYIESRGFKILLHSLTESSGLFLDFKKPLQYIKKDFMTNVRRVKRFPTLKKLRNNQYIVCINKDQKFTRYEIKKLKSYDHSFIDSLVLIFYLVFYKIVLWFFLLLKRI